MFTVNSVILEVLNEKMASIEAEMEILEATAELTEGYMEDLLLDQEWTCLQALAKDMEQMEARMDELQIEKTRVGIAILAIESDVEQELKEELDKCFKAIAEMGVSWSNLQSPHLSIKIK